MTDNLCPCPDPLAPCEAYGGLVLGEYRWKVCRGEVLTPAQCEAYRREWKRRARGEKRTTVTATSQQNVKPMPVTEWPQWAKRLERLKQPEDKGVGDTLTRILAKKGGDWFKRTMKRLGINCGCVARQEWMNRNYPYAW